MWIKIKEFAKTYEAKIILVVGFILVAVLSFEAGMLKGQKTQQNSVIVKAPENQAVCGASSEQAPKPPEAQNLASGAPNTADSMNIPPKNCAFVGSKNSNKYHVPSCQFAKRIKPENIVCFSSADDAAKKGYQPDKGCVK